MIFQLSDFLFPETPARLFPDTAERPWVLEVGFGDGRFWPPFAQTFPEAPNYLGVELSGVSLLKAERRLRAAGLPNAVLTKLPASVVVREVIPAGSLDAIIVNFPDPWPKAGHTEQRLLRVPFFQLAANRLKPGGAVLLTTDHDEYFEFACAEAEASGMMRVELAEPPTAALETKYALKWRDLGLGVHHARFIPTAHPADSAAVSFAPYPKEESAVPHAILRLPDALHPQNLSQTHFDKYTARGGQHAADPVGWTVVLLDAYRSLAKDGLVFLAHVVEGELTQEVLVNVNPRPDGQFLVRLARFGGPIITPGVKAAVATVTAWLEERGGETTNRGY